MGFIRPIDGCTNVRCLGCRGINLKRRVMFKPASEAVVVEAVGGVVVVVVIVVVGGVRGRTGGGVGRSSSDDLDHDNNCCLAETRNSNLGADGALGEVDFRWRPSFCLF